MMEGNPPDEVDRGSAAGKEDGQDPPDVSPERLERRIARVEELRRLCRSGVPAAAAWRTVKPNARANDRAAAEQARREIRWYENGGDSLYQAVQEKLQEELRKRQCRGVEDRPCEKMVRPPRQHCTACAKEQRRRKKQGYNRDYSQDNREALSTKQRQRRHAARERAAAEARQKRREAEQARLDAMPRIHSGNKIIGYYNTDTGQKVYTDKEHIEMMAAARREWLARGGWRL